MCDADFYIAPGGDDHGDGTFQAPFATFERAKQAVRDLPKEGRTGITVAVAAGRYAGGVTFSQEDSGTADCPITYRACGEGAAVLSCGRRLTEQEQVPLQETDGCRRIPKEVHPHIVCYDLTKCGLTAADWGKLYPVGRCNSVDRYDGDWQGKNAVSLLCGGKRMTVARYPNEGEELHIAAEDMVQQGECHEINGLLNTAVDWDTVRNPRGDVYRMTPEVAQRMSRWQAVTDAWMFGTFRYDWADSATPVAAYDPATRLLTTKFVEYYGIGVDDFSYFHFYNVLEELDAPGEYYLDRQTGLLYVYPYAAGAELTAVVSAAPVIAVQGAEYLTFEGLHLRDANCDGISGTGNHITLCRCELSDVEEQAVALCGFHNTVTGCEIHHTGKGGVRLDGGECASLTPGDNRVEDNHIHHWAEVYKTNAWGVELAGVGNYCGHNELDQADSSAVFYGGNNHLIEYNDIHHVCRKTFDGAAIYAGRRWDWYGNVIRYNRITALGSPGYDPVGIYLDDGLAGQTVYGNIVMDAGWFAVLIGGGRDNRITGNVFIHCGTTAPTEWKPAVIHVDQRGRNTILGGPYDHSIYDEGGTCWQYLEQSPWRSEVWQQAFPAYQTYCCDLTDTDNPDLVPNPANIVVADNVIFNDTAALWDVSAEPQFFQPGDNPVFPMSELPRFFRDASRRDFTVVNREAWQRLLPQLDPAQIEQIGRR